MGKFGQDDMKKEKKNALSRTTYGNSRTLTDTNSMLLPSVAHVGGVGVEPHMLGIPASLAFSHSKGEGLFPSHACSMESCAVVGLHWASRSSSGNSGHFQQRCSDSGKEFILQDIIVIVCPMLAYRKHLPNNRNELDDSEGCSVVVSLMKVRI